MEWLVTFSGFIGLGIQYLWNQIDLNFDEVFLRVLDMTKTGLLVIFAVLLLRWLLRKAPKVCSYVLWAVVLFRLLCPLSLEAQWAVLPEVETGDSYTLANDDITFSGAAGAAVRAVGDAANGGLGIQYIRTADDEIISSYWWEVWVLFGKYVWVAGMLVMLVHAIVSYGKLRKKLRLSMPWTDGHWANDVVKERPRVFLADGITSAFVIGLFRPKIYLPSDLSGEELDYILRHERHHIMRGDHIWKLLGFAALCIHWLNPLVWEAFRLAEKDMEMSCDEAVLKQLGPEIRKDYCASLLRLATGKRLTVGIPLAFGEGDASDRVKHVMKYKKPAIFVTVGAMCLVLIAVIFLSTNEATGNTELLSSTYRATVEVYDTDGTGGVTESGPYFCVTGDYQLYRMEDWEEQWTYLGTLEPYDLTKDELKDYASIEKYWVTSYRLRQITDAYILRVENDMFYLVFQTKNGDTLLGYGWEDMGERGQDYSDDTSLEILYRLEATADAVPLLPLKQQEKLLSIFREAFPEVEPVDWVLADDGAEDLLGVVLYSDERGQAEFILVNDFICGHTGIGARLIPESQLVYEGDATVSVVLLGTDGTVRRSYMSYCVSTEEKGVNFTSWDEPIEE